MKTLFVYFILPLALVTSIMAVIYGSVQQSYRTGANDPQIGLTQDIVNKLHKGVPLEKIISRDTVDIASSLSTFTALYDEGGKPIISTGFLDGKMIMLPLGVFNYLKDHDDDWITWQPRPGVRMAMIVKRSGSSSVSFVAVGRSLEQVELREHSLRVMIIWAWLICIVLVIILGIVTSPKHIII